MATAEKTVAYTETTPSGLQIEFQSVPKRLYRLRQSLGYITDLEEREAFSDWIEVPSVTTVLDVLSKPALVFWGFGVGLEVALYAGKELNYDLAECSVDDLKAIANEYKIGPNHRKRTAGDRGLNVHSALENWVKEGTLPVVEFYPETEQGYIRALLAFIQDVGELKQAKTEVMVGSLVHEYAGRYDLEAVLSDCSLVTKRRGEIEHRVNIPKGRYLLDAKTSKNIYVSQYVQLEAYEAARVECGYRPTVGRMVVRFDQEGFYEVGISKLSPEYFYAIKACYEALKDAEATSKGA